MKKFISALLVLTMVLALASTAMAVGKGPVEFIRNAHTYSAPKNSKKNVSAVKAGSQALCDKICGSFARVIVSKSNDKRWFKKSALEQVDEEDFNWNVVWAKGGKDMSLVDMKKTKLLGLSGKVKVTGHTNLRKQPSLECKSQGVVESGKCLKLTGYVGMDDRGVVWYEVCYRGQKLWLSDNFAKLPNATIKKLRAQLEKELEDMILAYINEILDII